MKNKIIGALLVVGAIGLVVGGTAIGEAKGHRLIGTGSAALVASALLFEAGKRI